MVDPGQAKMQVGKGDGKIPVLVALLSQLFHGGTGKLFHFRTYIFHHDIIKSILNLCNIGSGSQLHIGVNAVGKPLGRPAEFYRTKGKQDIKLEMRIVRRVGGNTTHFVAAPVISYNKRFANGVLFTKVFYSR